jgi:hypothetical protein
VVVDKCSAWSPDLKVRIVESVYTMVYEFSIMCGPDGGGWSRRKCTVFRGDFVRKYVRYPDLQ